MLSSLGLGKQPPLQQHTPTTKKRTKPRKISPVARPESTRRSSRLMRQAAPEVCFVDQRASQEDVDGGESDEDSLPQTPNDLNPLEKTVYHKLSDWRLAKARSLDSEVYRIAQNRTLCELVRVVPSSNQELLEIWGLADVKIAQFGDDILEILDNNKRLLSLNSSLRNAMLKCKEARKRKQTSDCASEKTQGELEKKQKEDAEETRQYEETKLQNTKAKKCKSDKTKPIAGQNSNPDGFIGVYKAQGSKGKTRWRAQIHRPKFFDNRQIWKVDQRRYLGTYDTTVEAAKQYDRAARIFSMQCNFRLVEDEDEDEHTPIMMELSDLIG